MRNISICFFWVLAACLFASCMRVEEDRDAIVLRATHELGVPVHREVGGEGGFERAPDGAEAVVLETVRGGDWLRIRLADGQTGWISRRYVGRAAPDASEQATPVLPAEVEVWDSPEGCRRAVASGERMSRDSEDAVRVATWNVRWFPRGCAPGQDCPEKETNVDWLACTVAWMDVDLLAVQEILTTDTARERMNTLIDTLNTLSDGDWAVDLQECGGEGAQRVGFLWNRRRLTLSRFADAAQLNGAFHGTNSACAGNLRPGRYAYVEAPGGVDFHAVSVHFDSGTNERDFRHRRTAMRSIPVLQVEGQVLLATDPDVVILGDFNTMGQEDPSNVSATEEIALMDRELGGGYRRAGTAPNCTQYFEGRAGTLDHVVVSTGMREAAAEARVTGYCAVRGCGPLGGMTPTVTEQLSDHCPVVFDIRNEDVD